MRSGSDVDYNLSDDDIIMAESHHSEDSRRSTSQLSEALEALIRDQPSGEWSNSRGRFLACVFETYTRCMGVLVVINQQMNAEMQNREANVKAREERMDQLEYQLQRNEDLRGWQDRLRQEQIRLDARRRDFDEEVIKSLREVFRQFATWESEFSTARGPPGPRYTP